jgi:hypothetical protein
VETQKTGQLAEHGEEQVQPSTNQHDSGTSAVKVTVGFASPTRMPPPLKPRNNPEANFFDLVDDKQLDSESTPCLCPDSPLTDSLAGLTHFDCCSTGDDDDDDDDDTDDEGQSGEKSAKHDDDDDDEFQPFGTMDDEPDDEQALLQAKTPVYIRDCMEVRP